MDMRRPAGSQIGTLLLLSLLATTAVAETCGGPVTAQDCLGGGGVRYAPRVNGPACFGGSLDRCPVSLEMTPAAGSTPTPAAPSVPTFVRKTRPPRAASEYDELDPWLGKGNR